ncbi:MAG: hypothetical protein WC147_10135 [Syntrophomonas sp.]
MNTKQNPVISDELKIIVTQVQELEMQNARLQDLVDKLTEQLESQAVDEHVEHFLDLLQTDIEMKEKCILNDQRLIDLIAAYRQIRPK